MVRMFLTSSLVASIALLAFVLLPAAWAGFVDAGEDEAFRLGLSLEVISGLEAPGNLANHEYTERNNGNVIGAFLNDATSACEGPTSGATENAFDSVLSNITGILHFGENYSVTTYDENAGICTQGITAGELVDQSTFVARWTVDFDDLVQAEVIRFVLHHPNASVSFDGFQMSYAIRSSITPASTNTVQLTDGIKFIAIPSGTVLEVPISTQTRLQILGGGPPVGAELFAVVSVVYIMDFADHPEPGDVLIWDGELTKSREGLLTNQGSLVIFNVIWLPFAIVIGIVMTPFATWKSLNFFRGRS